MLAGGEEVVEGREVAAHKVKAEVQLESDQQAVLFG